MKKLKKILKEEIMKILENDENDLIFQFRELINELSMLEGERKEVTNEFNELKKGPLTNQVIEKNFELTTRHIQLFNSIKEKIESLKELFNSIDSNSPFFDVVLNYLVDHFNNFNHELKSKIRSLLDNHPTISRKQKDNAEEKLGYLIRYSSK